MLLGMIKFPLHQLPKKLKEAIANLRANSVSITSTSEEAKSVIEEIENAIKQEQFPLHQLPKKLKESCRCRLHFQGR